MSHALAVIVAAGGSGARFGRPEGKQLAPVLGRPLLAWTVSALGGPPVESIVVVCHPRRVQEYEETVIAPLGLRVPVTAVGGGDSRQESVALGLAEVPESFEFVAVHDGARPLVSLDMLVAALTRLETPGVDGVVVGHPCYDTLKHVESGRVVSTPDRSLIWVAQTPQVFRRESLLSAYEHALSSGFVGTDDASVVENWGGVVDMVEASRENIKVTTAQDVRFVEAVLRDRQEAGQS
ncbi:MAG: 2-C-methyl-D-erythritol 4-phosphate cytidylyltransferase [Actinobacteria bacterium HGW-Actinobacteria-7]|nr:MAG: 2-C-methyl-D-erythritol 4-phosphate cytidylyltransferase [Actinobacteria bacterium HGW-Actinobacteria-7]